MNYNGLKRLDGLQFGMTLADFNKKLKMWTNLTKDQVERMYQLGCAGKVIYVTGKHGPIGKSSLVVRLSQLGMQAIEIDIDDLIIIKSKEELK